MELLAFKRNFVRRNGKKKKKKILENQLTENVLGKL